MVVVGRVVPPCQFAERPHSIGWCLKVKIEVNRFVYTPLLLIQTRLDYLESK